MRARGLPFAFACARCLICPSSSSTSATARARSCGGRRLRANLSLRGSSFGWSRRGSGGARIARKVCATRSLKLGRARLGGSVRGTASGLKIHVSAVRSRPRPLLLFRSRLSPVADYLRESESSVADFLRKSESPEASFPTSPRLLSPSESHRLRRWTLPGQRQLSLSHAGDPGCEPFRQFGRRKSAIGRSCPLATSAERCCRGGKSNIAAIMVVAVRQCCD
jgi:hypothetical protein